MGAGLVGGIAEFLASADAAAEELLPTQHRCANYPNSPAMHRLPPTTTAAKQDAAAKRRPGGGRRRPLLTIPELSHVCTFLATALVVPFEHLRMTDVEAVGGKNASLGEMISQLAASGVRVPGGFATTAHAFRAVPGPRRPGRAINAKLDALDTDDVRALAAAGAQIRQWVEVQPFPAGSGSGHPRRVCRR
jgi:hypothetical protein